MKSPYGPTFTALDRDTGNEVLWRQIEIGKADRSIVNLIILIAALTNWMQELQGVIRLDCKNIVNYLSCEHRSYHELVLISEMMTRGSFGDYLAGLKQPRLTICQNWFRQILYGLSTLHEKKITHGKLSCEHIFINSNTGEVKIGDLSLVKLEEIISNRLLPHRSIDDIHQFGLLILEIAFSQTLPNSKLKTLMKKYYNSISLDTKRISSLAQYIEDELYRSLLLYCINANDVTTAMDVFNHPFFSKSYTKEEVLKTVRSKGRRLTESSKLTSTHLNPQREKSLTVVSNSFKPLNVKSLNITLKIITNEVDLVISFKYNTEIDTPEGISQEMKETLNLPEIYTSTFQNHLEQICNNIFVTIVVVKYWKDDSKKLGKNQIKSENIAESAATPKEHRLKLNKSTNNQTFESGSNTCYCKWKSKLERTEEGLKKRSLQSDITFTDMQQTPRTGIEEEIEFKSKHKPQDEEAKLTQ